MVKISYISYIIYNYCIDNLIGFAIVCRSYKMQ